MEVARGYMVAEGWDSNEYSVLSLVHIFKDSKEAEIEEDKFTPNSLKPFFK